MLQFQPYLSLLKTIYFTFNEDKKEENNTTQVVLRQLYNYIRIMVIKLENMKLWLILSSENLALFDRQFLEPTDIN